MVSGPVFRYSGAKPDTIKANWCGISWGTVGWNEIRCNFGGFIQIGPKKSGEEYVDKITTPFPTSRKAGVSARQ